MKKLIIALDGKHFPKGAFELVQELNKKEEILLAGVFLSPVDYSKILAYTGVEGITMMPDWLMKNDDDMIISTNISLFTKACTEAGINFRVHKDLVLTAISSLIEETRFADALLISSDLFYENVSKEQPNFYLEEVLKRSECPVMLVPENYTWPEQVVLAYDGSESAVFAIKQFAYIFPELAKKKTLLLNMNDDEELPGSMLATELFSRHFPELVIEQLLIKNAKDLIAWMQGQAASFIVMGSFSRSLLSTFFKKSFASNLISNIRMPLFISHK